MHGGPFLLRLILAERDSDHYQRADCDRHRASKRQLENYRCVTRTRAWMASKRMAQLFREKFLQE
jgi:hypothetical protein